MRQFTNLSYKIKRKAENYITISGSCPNSGGNATTHMIFVGFCGENDIFRSGQKAWKDERS
jgi:hypothetical protein